jgi:hypothetical protein
MIRNDTCIELLRARAREDRVAGVWAASGSSRSNFLAHGAQCPPSAPTVVPHLLNPSERHRDYDQGERFWKRARGGDTAGRAERDRGRAKTGDATVKSRRKSFVT